MDRVRLLLPSLLTAALAACGGPAPARAPVVANTVVEGDGTVPPPALFGSYREPHTVMMVCSENEDGWCEEEVADAMEIRDGGAGKLAVAIELVQTNAHTCTFEGTLAPDADPDVRRWTFHQPEEGDGEGPCKLQLEHAGDELRLAAEGCRYYCGARASLDATFHVAGRTP